MQALAGQVGAAVRSAIRAGYRHIDCAFIYLNEAEIGEALTDMITQGVVRREELFITTKVLLKYMQPVRPNGMALVFLSTSTQNIVDRAIPVSNDDNALKSDCTNATLGK